jgi:hypothetical protein
MLLNEPNDLLFGVPALAQRNSARLRRFSSPRPDRIPDCRSVDRDPERAEHLSTHMNASATALQRTRRGFDQTSLELRALAAQIESQPLVDSARTKNAGAKQVVLGR